jgi:pantetheine-phosphate adenylyltransferase
LTEYCKLLGADVIVKGLRNASDLAGELPQANVNRDLSGIETLYLPSDPTLSYVSSSLVRQVAELGGDITKYVPASIAETYARKLRND